MEESETQQDRREAEAAKDLAISAFRAAGQRAEDQGHRKIPLQVILRKAGLQEESDENESIPSSSSGLVDSAKFGYRLGPGMPFTATGPGVSARDPRLVGKTLSGFLSENRRQIMRAQVSKNWANIVGQRIASWTLSVQVQKNKLLVRTRSTAQAEVLKLYIPQIMGKIGASDMGIEGMVVRGPSDITWKKGFLSVRGRGPRDTYG